MKVIKYGHVAERPSLLELIPGFGTSADARRQQLISFAYTTNGDKGNDPNVSCDNVDWFQIVRASFQCNIDASLVHEMELASAEIVYYDCDSYQHLIISSNDHDDDDALVSCESSLSNEVDMDPSPIDEIEEFPKNATGHETITAPERMDGAAISNTPDDVENFGIQALRDAGHGAIAQGLVDLSKSFKRQLNAIGISNAYSLHLRALYDA
ncbi:hypothetical protein BdWA1_003104 [Babesia duncani]|uniref:Uncharacterized protein n=1 Tax=Babesia duncani TaxID=323732 RepID=A0AAD9UMU5_9APIC|nr:hypothetical protein BdWA1_003104 [Babesia duncani]